MHIKKLIFVALCALLLAFGAPVCAQHAKIGGSGGAVAAVQMLADAFQKTHPDATFFVMPKLGTSGGLRALSTGVVDIAIAGRALTEVEASGGARVQPLGKTPAAFAVRADNPTTQLSLAELAQFYAAANPKWPSGARLRLILRPEDDIDTKLIDQLSPAVASARAHAQARAGMITAASDTDAARLIERTPGGLGLTTLALVASEKRNVKLLTLDGIAPTVKNAKNATYPMVRSFYLVTKPNCPVHIQAFVDYATSAAGRTLLESVGFFHVDVRKG